MTGVRIEFARCDQGEMKLLEYADAKVRDAISLISAPARVQFRLMEPDFECCGKWRAWVGVPANAFSLPVIIMAPMSLLSSYFVRASLSSLKSGLDRALRALGRLRVTRPKVS